MYIRLYKPINAKRVQLYPAMLRIFSAHSSQDAAAKLGFPTPTMTAPAYKSVDRPPLDTWVDLQLYMMAFSVVNLYRGAELKNI